MRTGTTSACVFLFLVALAGAQPTPSGPRRGGAARDDAFRMVDAYIVSNLQESLGLTDE